MGLSLTVVRRFVGQHHALALPLGLGLTVGACTDSRHEAITELRRLDEAMQQHAAVYGRFPATLDPHHPVSLTNLPYAPEREVNLRLLGSTEDSYGARAGHGVWVCWIGLGPGKRGEPDCAPTGDGSRDDAPNTPGQPAFPLEGILTPQSEAPAQSGLPPSSSP